MPEEQAAYFQLDLGLLLWPQKPPSLPAFASAAMYVNVGQQAHLTHQKHVDQRSIDVAQPYILLGKSWH